MKFFALAGLKRMALCLGMLAVCSALMAPGSVLSQEAGSGKWSSLCLAGGTNSPDEHVQADEGHCALCPLPGLACLGANRHQNLRLEFAAPIGPTASAAVVLRSVAPAIRGPPNLL